MKIEGSADIPAPREKVWAAFLDPNILAQALPGCEKLEAIGPNEYKATMKVGVAAIKGTFEGKVQAERPRAAEPLPHGGRGQRRARASSAATRACRCPTCAGGTKVSYDADVQVGGLIASVGQRMLGGVTKMMLDQFFTRMTELLTSKPA